MVRTGALVVTGTNTGVGKTVVTAALAALAREHGRSVAVVKPAQTGVEPGGHGDLAEIQRLSGVNDLHELVRYPDPLSPEAAARCSGSGPLVFEDVAAYVRKLALDRDVVLIEGAGGLLVRYSTTGWTIADLAKSLDAHALVVCSAGLGTLNHTALTLEALAQRGVLLSTVVIGSWPEHPRLAECCNLVDLETVAGRPIGGVLPHGAPASHEFARLARLGLAVEYGGVFDAAEFRRHYEERISND